MQDPKEGLLFLVSVVLCAAQFPLQAGDRCGKEGWIHHPSSQLEDDGEVPILRFEDVGIVPVQRNAAGTRFGPETRERTVGAEQDALTAVCGGFACSEVEEDTKTAPLRVV